MKKKFILFSFLFMLFSISFGCLTVQAAQKSNIGLKANKTYTKYDITGDGKADKIRINFKSQSYLNIQVNGKTRYKLNAKSIYRINTNLYTLKGNRHFLKLKCQNVANDHIDYDKLLAYKSGKLTPVINLMSHRKGAWNGRHNSFTKKVGSDYIQIRMQSMPGGVGAIQYTLTYKLSGSSLKLSSSTFPVTYSGCQNPLLSETNIWTAAKELSLKNAPGGKERYRTDIYEICTVNKIRYYNGSAYIYITAEDAGVSGWVRCPNTYNTRFFEETFYI